MYTASELDEYLAEIRSQVCANCVERPPGGPPCAPLGKLCGAEEHLPELIDAVHSVYSGSVGPYFENKQRRICEHCWFRKSEYCPCPMDYLLVLVVEAVETVDARHERRRNGWKRLAGDSATDGGDVREIRALFETAAHAWTGCDWPTKYGQYCFDLNGWTAVEARRKANRKRTVHAAEWKAAAEWLATIEIAAKQAEEFASQAVRHADAEEWTEAFEMARLAWEKEFATGRLLWRGFPMTWQRFFLAVEAAASLHPNATQADQEAPSR